MVKESSKIVLAAPFAIIKKGSPFEILSLFLADLPMSGVHFLAESIPQVAFSVHYPQRRNIHGDTYDITYVSRVIEWQG